MAHQATGATMTTGIVLPEIGSWFRRGDGKTFKVVAVDEKDQAVEIQHFDGTVEEVAADSWQEMVAQPVDAPEDWSGSMDVDSADLPDDEETHQDFDDPLDFVDGYES